jgi:hypothetical protein
MDESMNADNLKKVIGYDSQIAQFAMSMFAEATLINEEWSRLSLELVDFANKFGRFVQKEREEGFKVTPVEVPIAQ